MSNTITGPARANGSGYQRPATFTDTVRSEWTKLRSLHSSLYALLTMFLVIVGLSVVVVGGLTEEYPRMSPEEQATFDPVGDVFSIPVIVGQLAVMVLGVLTITSEHVTGMIRSSLAAVPRRGRLLAAKAAVLAVVTFVAGLATAVVVFFISQSLLAYGGLPSTTLGQPHVLRAIAGMGLYLAAAVLLALAVGALVRATAGGVFIMLTLAILLPQLLPAILPGRVGELVAEYWPTMVGLAILYLEGGAGGQTAVWGGFGILCVTVAALLAVAFAVFRARDV